MSHDAPMLADFAVRLAFGMARLAHDVLAERFRSAFFRTHCQVILGLLVLAALDASRLAGPERERRDPGLRRRAGLCGHGLVGPGAARGSRCRPPA